ncbi:alpha/beta fold hydrolase [Chloroflexota bacterium]
MDRKYIKTSDGQVHYRTEGTGEPVLLLHCATLSSDEFSEVIPIIARRYLTLAMDLPGYGMSDKLPRKYSIEDYAQSVVNFMGTVAISKASIVGSGSGSSIAGEIAITHPERVDKLILSSCPYYTPKLRELRLKDQRFKSMEIKEDGSHLMKAWDYLRNYVFKSRPETWHRVVINYLQAGIDAEDVHQAVFRYKMEERLQLIKHPTLLISGEDDVNYNVLKIVKSLIPRSRTVLMDGAGIGGSIAKWEHPEAFSKLIMDFLANSEV